MLVLGFDCRVRWVLSTIAALALLGCGGRVAVEHDSTAAAGRGAEGETPDRVPPGRGLIDAPPNERESPTLAAIVDREVRLLSLDGSARTVLDSRFFSGIDQVHFVGAVGDYFAVEGYPVGAKPGAGMRVALLSKTGVVRWQRSFPWSEAVQANEWWVTLSHDGTLIFSRADSLVTAVSPDETSADYAGGDALGGAVDGFLPVQLPLVGSETDYTIEHGWWKIGSGAALTASVTSRGPRPDALASDSPWFFGGRLLHLAENNGHVELLARAPDRTLTIPIPNARRTTWIMRQREPNRDDERWLLVDAGARDQFVRVDLRSATATPLSLVAPAGYRPLPYCPSDDSTIAPGIDVDGYIYGVFRTDEHAAVFTTLDGEHWARVGGTFAARGQVGLTVHGGTYEIRGIDSVDCFTGGLTWSAEGAADFSGNVSQLVRRASGASTVLRNEEHDASFEYSRTGRYAARWASGVLRVLDLETSSLSELATDTTAEHVRPTWIDEP